MSSESEESTVQSLNDDNEVPVDSTDAGTICDALGSETARRLSKQLQNQPKTPRELADALDVTVQNIHYHLDKLKESGIVETADTVYTETGNEVQLFRTTSSAVTLVFGRSGSERRTVDELGRLVSSLLLVAVGGLLLRLTSNPFHDQNLTPPATNIDLLLRLVRQPGLEFVSGGIVALAVFILIDYVVNRNRNR